VVVDHHHPEPLAALLPVRHAAATSLLGRSGPAEGRPDGAAAARAGSVGLVRWGGRGHGGF
jgi:hypothetical protein